MKINSIVLLLFISLFIFVGCYDDKGNYDYRKLNKIEISDVSDKYYVNVGDTIIIEPKLAFALDSNVNVDYEWNLNMEQVLSNEKDLFFIVPDTCDSSESILLKIEEKSTGFKTQIETSLNISQIYSEGWLILSEKDGKSALDFIRRDWIEEKDGEDIYEFKEFFDVYKKAEKEYLGSQPLHIQEHWRSGDYFNDGHVMVVQKGGQGCVDLFGGNLRKSLNTVKEFTTLPDNYDPKDILYAEQFSYILNSDGKLYSRKNFSDEAYYSGYFSDYPVCFDDNGVFKELNVDRFIHGVAYQDEYFILVYEKENKRFLAISEFDYWKKDEDSSGTIMTLDYDNYPNNKFIPLHNTGDNELFYSKVHGDDGSTNGLYSIFKTPEGKFVEQQINIYFDIYGSSSMVIEPVMNRHFPDGFMDETCIVDVPDGGGGYGSTNIFISKGNKLYYYSRVATGEIILYEYYSFNSDIVAMEDQHFRNSRMCVGLANGDVYFMDITDEAIGGQTEKILHKVSKPSGNIKEIIHKHGDYRM